MQIEHSSNGDTVTFVPKVVDAGHHQRQLLRLTGLDTEENQARRLLSDLESWMATQDDYAPGDPLGARPEVLAHRWVREVFRPDRAGRAARAARARWTRPRSTTSSSNTAGTCPSGRSTTSAWTTAVKDYIENILPKARQALPPPAEDAADRVSRGGRSHRPAHSCGTTATGQCAWCSTPWATEPIRAPTAVRWARRPTTISWARAATDSSTCPALPISTCWMTGTSGKRSRHGSSAAASAFLSYGSRPPASSRSFSEPGL